MLCVKYVFLQHQEMHLTVERGNLESEGLRLATGKAPKNRTGFAIFRSRTFPRYNLIEIFERLNIITVCVFH